MPVDVDVAAAAELIGHPARAAMLGALMDDRGLPATELAAAAAVSAPTASSHLARLLDGGLVTVERHGRHRYYRLAGHQVAEAIEALARIAPPGAAPAPVAGSRTGELRAARTCYDHLAGALGVALADALQREGTLERRDGAFTLTPAGEARLRELGVDLDAVRGERRAFARACLDWSERRDHIAGALGAALLRRLLELGWIERDERSRAMHLTDAGRTALPQRLGVALAAAADGW
jgi:DNA-binding transcriptional ArsR family regulator